MTNTSLEEITQEELDREEAFKRFMNEVPKRWWQPAGRAYKDGQAYKDTLAHQAFTVLPQEKDLRDFEKLGFRQRQLVLARLRQLESDVNLKTLPTVIPFIAFIGVVAGWGFKTIDPAQQIGSYLILIGSLTAVIVGTLVAILLAGKAHTRKEACYTAWVEALKDSHTLKTKMDEEDRKAERDAAAKAEEDRKAERDAAAEAEAAASLEPAPSAAAAPSNPFGFFMPSSGKGRV